MKYIKTFESKITNDFLEELEDFIDANLVYLLDMGPMYSGYVIQDKLKDKVKITIRLSIQDLSFKWDDVKDYMIPFIYRLDNQYKIEEIKYFCSYYNKSMGERTYLSDTTSKDQIINDELELKGVRLDRIEIIIKK